MVNRKQLEKPKDRKAAYEKDDKRAQTKTGLDEDVSVVHSSENSPHDG